MSGTAQNQFLNVSLNETQKYLHFKSRKENQKWTQFEYEKSGRSNGNFCFLKKNLFWCGFILNLWRILQTPIACQKLDGLHTRVRTIVDKAIGHSLKMYEFGSTIAPNQFITLPYLCLGYVHCSNDFFSVIHSYANHMICLSKF